MTSLFLLACMIGQHTPDEVQFAIGYEALSNSYGHQSAIRYFHDALRMAPWNSTYAEGLALARSLVDYSAGPDVAALLEPEQYRYPGWLLHPLVVAGSYAAYLAIFVAFIRWLRCGNKVWLTTACILILPALIAPSSVIVLHNRAERDRLYPYRVATLDRIVRVGNGHNYPVILRIPRGTEYRIILVRGAWTQIEMGSGLRGWLYSS